jgi:hypothetical protein
MNSIANFDYLWDGKLSEYKKHIYPGSDCRQRPLFGGGVYFLWNSNGLQYVGQSDFVWGRLEKHHVICKSKKDRSAWLIGVIPVKDSRERLRLEAYCITAFRPARNTKIPNANRDEIESLRSQGKTLQFIGDRFGVSRERIRQILNDK